MEMATERKLFTAEVQRLKARGMSLAAATTPVGDLAEVLSAISALRDEVREFGQTLQGAPVAPHEADPVPGAVPEFEEKCVEVNMLKTEVRALSIAINQTKMEIAALRRANSGDDRLVAVTNELDAIVTSTERATHSILEASEKIDNLAGQIQAQVTEGFAGQIAEDIRDTVVAIFEACNFQDITGQRITKVVKTLQFIEERVNKMIEIWGPDTFEDLPQAPEISQDQEARLLNGPALENQGVSQADIDKLFD